MTDVIFRVLGPLEVEQGGQLVPIAPGKQRVVLAALLLRANRTVSIAELTDVLWDGFPPADARGTVQKYVMRLRRALARTGAVIHTESDGYRIEVLPGQLDLERCDALIEQGANAARAGDPRAAAACFAEALRLWRAVPPLMNVASAALLRYELPRLVEQYLQALELRIDADLRLGRHAALAGELMGLVRAYPLRERFWAQRMRALYATGRQGEALEAYREVTRLLADELGIDPGPELRAAHEEILRRDEPGATTAQGGPAMARQLPMAPAGLVGRWDAVEQVTWSLGAAGSALVVITGAPGIGKSAVAVYAAHLLSGRYPDGQLFADLRSHRDGPAPTEEETLARFLRALGVPATALPERRDEAIAAYRTLTADRRLLVVLDDAADPDQVRTLLPGGTTCGVLVTSRHELAGLLIAPGARPVALATLCPVDARDVLREVVGAERVDAEPEATADLLAVCGGLPLALRVAAARLATRPRMSISAYVDELLPDPLAALRVERDEPESVARALDTSYGHLGPDERRLLRLLGAGPAGTVTAAEAAMLAGTTEQAAASGLEQLAEAGLLERDRHGYRMHPLTRAFARSRTNAERTPAKRRRIAELSIRSSPHSVDEAR